MGIDFYYNMRMIGHTGDSARKECTCALDLFLLRVPSHSFFAHEEKSEKQSTDGVLFCLSLVAFFFNVEERGEIECRDDKNASLFLV